MLLTCILIENLLFNQNKSTDQQSVKELFWARQTGHADSIYSKLASMLRDNIDIKQSEYLTRIQHQMLNDEIFEIIQKFVWGKLCRSLIPYKFRDFHLPFGQITLLLNLGLIILDRVLIPPLKNLLKKI